MKPFDEYLNREAKRSMLRDKQWQIERDRRRTREERKMRRLTMICAAACLAALVFAAWVIWSFPPESKAIEPPVAEVKNLSAAMVMYEPAPVEEEPEDFENEKIEAALVEQEYFREDIPLDYDTQAFLRAACDESGIDYELALAVVWKETTFRNIVGDGGNSFGYMQVQPRWHRDRMERLGVTDLMDPFGNFRVGCDYLAELLEKYELPVALTFYNTGKPGHNQYADTVIGYMEGLR